ncbi:hypothetical protein [Peterkaempfera griseoplana]|nr:hypothetical protein [Peterkaempfera griseoplana]
MRKLARPGVAPALLAGRAAGGVAQAGPDAPCTGDGCSGNALVPSTF